MVPVLEPFESIARRAAGTRSARDCLRPSPRATRLNSPQRATPLTASHLLTHCTRLATASARRSPGASRYEQLQKGGRSYLSVDSRQSPVRDLLEVVFQLLAAARMP